MTLPAMGLAIESRLDPSEEVAWAQASERAGAEVVLPIANAYARDGLISAAHLSAATETIRVGTGTVSPYTIHPTAIAVAAAQMQLASRGRLVLGLGTGMPEALERAGLSLGAPAAVMREATDSIKRLFAGDRVATEGEAFALAGFHLSDPPDPPPAIWIAAMGPSMLKLAGELADGVLLPAVGSPAYVAWASAKVRDGARRAGRDPRNVTVVSNVLVGVGTEEGVRKAVRRAVAFHLASPHFGRVLAPAGLSVDQSAVRDAFKRRDWDEVGRLVTDDLVEECSVSGDIDEARRRLRTYREAGVDIACALPVGPSSREAMQRALRLWT